jgi:flagellar basal-body rod protein FlgG
MRALSTGATGMEAMSTQVDIIANNLANVNTTGFKRSRALFQDLFYDQLNQPGTLNGLSQRNSSGVQVGLGVQLASTMDVFEQGEFENTGRELDIAIKGRGFFAVKIYDDVGEGVGYTRNGVFAMDENGSLVLSGPDGFLMDPPITIPTDALAIDISGDGRVSVTTPGSVTPSVVGTIYLANFTNPEGLLKVGSNLYIKSGSSGDPVISEPGADGAGVLMQKHVEKSNTDPVRELTSLIEAQRAFELNSRVIASADEMLQVVNNLKL